MNITRYKILVLCLLLTIPQQTNSMESEGQLKNGAYIVGLATFFIGTAYGTFCLLEWLFPQQSKNKKGQMSSGDIKAGGSVTMSLRGTGHIDVSIGDVTS